MFDKLMTLREPILLNIISAIAIISSSLLGAACSWIITNKALCRNEGIQNRIAEETRNLQKHKDEEILKGNAAIIRLDICTVLFHGIKTLKISSDCREKLYMVPMNHDYASAVASLQKNFQLIELSYLYQIYGIIEKLNYDVRNLKYFNEEDFKLIIMDYKLLLESIYGDNYKEILKLNSENLSYNELWNNEYIKLGYRNVLDKLDKMCDEDS